MVATWAFRSSTAVGAGDTTVDGLAQLKKYLINRPRVVLVELGVNDLGRPECATAANLDTMFRWIQGSGAVAVFLEVLPPFSHHRAAQWKTFCEERGVIHVRDLLGPVERKPHHMNDAEHPSVRGHLMIAQRLEPLVRDVFEDGEE